MNRFEYDQFQLGELELLVSEASNVKLYDGPEKTKFDDGDLLLTSHRLFYGRRAEILAGSPVIALPLRFILSLDEETTSSLFSAPKTKLVLQLRSVKPSQKRPGPADQSTESHIKLACTSAHRLPAQFVTFLRDMIEARIWEADLPAGTVRPPQLASSQSQPQQQQRILRTGIVGIERQLAERQKETNETINVAFQDLSKLMVLAKDMVAVSQAISAKVVQRRGEISDDETVRLKAHLMGLGIDNPVLRDSVSDVGTFYTLLAQEIEAMLLDPIAEAGGMMPMTEAYCRINRARGLELLSAEDVFKACEMLYGAVRMRTFAASGTKVLQLETHDDRVVAEEVARVASQRGSVSLEELARVQRVSVLLAEARLLAAEQLAMICRDESIEGLRYYPNRFLQAPATD